MEIEIKLDKMSGHSTEGVVGKIHKNVNDMIEFGDELMDIESSKGNSTIISEYRGMILSLHVERGDKIKKGNLIYKIDGEKKEESKSQKTNTSQSNRGSIKSQGSTGFNYMSGLIKPREEEIETDIVIIGGGPGGYVSAIYAAQKNVNVVLVEKEELGGTCLNWGCIPTKALVKSSSLYSQMKRADEFGILVSDLKVDMKNMVKRKASIVDCLKGGIANLLEKNKVKLYRGSAQINKDKEVVVKSSKVKATIKAKDIIIATGSEVFIPPIEGASLEGVVTNKEIMELKDVPTSLTIIGAGVIGLEFAFIFNSLGTRVRVLEYASDVISSFDKDISDEIKEIAIEEGIEIINNAKVSKIDKAFDGELITTFEHDGKDKFISSQNVLMAIGRRPYTKDLFKESLGINIGTKGEIIVDEYLKTNIENIYAIGDVNNRLQLAHVASHQGIVAVDNILGQTHKMDYSVVPSVIFTKPEIACVGICEREAVKNKLDFEISKFPFAANGKALTLGETRGFVKLIYQKDSKQILGAHIIGPNAGELIHELALAIRKNLTLEDIAHTIHAHPTTSESIHEASLGGLETGFIHL